MSSAKMAPAVSKWAGGRGGIAICNLKVGASLELVGWNLELTAATEVLRTARPATRGGDAGAANGWQMERVSMAADMWPVAPRRTDVNQSDPHCVNPLLWHLPNRQRFYHVNLRQCCTEFLQVIG